jgi:glycosyltransferase involved in cell wall biosynthesis
MLDPWADLGRAADWLLSLEVATGADLVHLNHLVHGDLPWSVPVMSVGHSCVLSWWAAVRGNSAPLPSEWSTYRNRVINSLRACSCVVAPTLAMMEELQRLYGPFARTAVIFNGRNKRSFTAGRKQPMVFSAGRLWDEAKNVGTLAAVAPRLSVPVYVAGETRSPDGERVTLAGVQSLGGLDPAELASWYSRAAIYAMPARYEPFGLTALEAALSGCALVLGDLSSLREVWGPAARYVDPDDTDNLAYTINELAANDVLRRRYAARAMARARYFTPARQAQQYKLLYQELLGRDAQARSSWWSKPGGGRR